MLKNPTHVDTLYICSHTLCDHADSVEERNALMNIVYPQLKSLCYQFGYHFHMIDLYWGKECTVKEYSISFDDHHLKKTNNEIKLCQELSNGPSFIVSNLYYIDLELCHIALIQLLLSHRYCPRKLPVSILSEDFQLIYPLIDDPGVKSLIAEWYSLDNNANPPQYILQPPETK